jgi:lysozyme
MSDSSNLDNTKVAVTKLGRILFYRQYFSSSFSNQLQEQLCFEEDIKPDIYVDTNGKDTVAVGRNLSDNPYMPASKELIKDFVPLSGISIFQILHVDLSTTTSNIEKFAPWFKGMKEGARKDALRAMVFQLGIGTWLQFVKFRQCCELGNWELAAKEGLNSKWAKEDSPARAARVMGQLATGVYYDIRNIK